jgi:hypothetical protein
VPGGEGAGAKSYQFRVVVVKSLQEPLFPNELSMVITFEPMRVVHSFADSASQNMVQPVLAILDLKEYVPDQCAMFHQLRPFISRNYRRSLVDRFWV